MNERAKITTGHLIRQAIVYLRQSSAAQVEHNRESTERQYALANKARELGWPEERILVIDEDLGLSGSGAVARSGFARLTAEVALAHVGLVLGLEVSRLARNNADWHRLIDLAGITDTLIGDADGIYHPALFNDRLLLGLKGTMSEAELHVLRARLNGGIRNKAARGELRRGLPVGFVWGEADGEVLRHPDEAVVTAIRTIFARFAETGSARRVWLWLRDQGHKLPLQMHAHAEIRWGEASYHAIHQVLVNPVYAGAYVYGKTRTELTLDAAGARKKRIRHLPRDEWQVLIKEHHQGYIDWHTYEANQQRIAKNTRPGPHKVGGAVREGGALLQGLASCGHCGRRLRTHYSGRTSSPGYHCSGEHLVEGRGSCCLNIGGVQIDDAVARAFIAALEPATIAATLAAAEQLEAALRYAAELGWKIFPAHPRVKKSLKSAKYSNGASWGMTDDPVSIRKDFAKLKPRRIGIPTGTVNGFFVIEADTVEGHDVDGIASMRMLETKHGKLPDTLMAKSPSGSIHRYYKHPGGYIKNTASEIAPGVDVRGDGGMVIAPPSANDAGGTYQWLNWGTAITDAPEWLVALVQVDGAPLDVISGVDNEPQADVKELAAAMAAIPNGPKVGWAEWNNIGMALWRATRGSKGGVALFDEWSKRHPGYDAENTAERWAGYASCPPTKIGADLIRKKAKEASDAGKKIIRVRADNLSDVATTGEEALRDAGVSLYQRSGSLVRPVVEEVPASHNRKTKVARLVPVTPTYLRDLLGRIAVWQKFDGRSKSWVPTNPPADVAATILSREGEWGFASVTGILSTPTMRPDGTIINQEGFDEATSLLFLALPPMPPMPALPTRRDAMASLNRLKSLLKEFPFVSRVDVAVALSAIITPLARGAFPAAPGHAVRAPVAGSGKSYLFDVVAVIATGQVMPVISTGSDETELEKRLGAEVITGQPLVSVDNIVGELESKALCQIIERPRVNIRVLGTSERVQIDTRGTTAFFNGNNFVLVGDLCRRVLMAKLDPQVERPELRVFSSDPVVEVLAHRGRYIADALTICRAYAIARRPDTVKRLASFEGWSDVVRSALVWLGEADPVDSMEEARQEDPERVALRELLDAWAETAGVGWKYRVTLSKVLEYINLSAGFELLWPRLNSAVQTVAGRGRIPADAREFGDVMRKFKGRIVGEMKFVNDPKGKVTHWWIESERDNEKPGRWGELSADNE